MIALACLGFWVYGIAVGMWAAWMWHDLKDDES